MPKDLIGIKFGKLTIQSISINKGKDGSKLVMAICDCGKTVEKPLRHLKSGNTSSCGCLHIEMAKMINYKHGMYLTRTNKIWKQMKIRCLNPNHSTYKSYGGRGIKVCDRWLNSFEDFLKDMGHPPTPSHTLDRINGNGNYCPENCRWATRIEQASNTSRNVLLDFKGERMTMAGWSRKTGLSAGAIRHRFLDLGWSAEKTLTTPKMGI